MKISKRDTNLLLILLGILIFIGAYSGVRNSYGEKTEKVHSEIESIQLRLDELNSYYENIAEYQSKIEEIDTYTETALARYPNEIRTEDFIMYALELENKVGIDITDISFAEPQVISQFNVVVSGDGEDKYIPTAIMSTSMSATCTLTYVQYKRLADYIRDTIGHTTLDNITVSFDSETGRLIGSFVITKYFICNENYTYKPTDVPSVNMGTSDPFGTFTVNAADNSEE